MGVLVATITEHQMMAYKSDLEYKILLINQSKLSLAESANDLLDAGTDLDPESPVVKQLEQRKARINQLEKKLDMQLAQYQTQLKMANDNLELCKSQMGGK